MTTEASVAHSSYFPGDSEMALRMRDLDWSTTSLGPPEHWPQSLRSAVSILLSSKAEIILFWGDDLVALYNDAYAPTFGSKHPWALGKPARECWSEIWDFLGPIFEGVKSTGSAFAARDNLFLLERSGYVEETYYDVSYDPVMAEGGAIGGVFCIVADKTGEIIGKRRLNALKQLAEETTRARTAIEACGLAAEVLAEHDSDVPFALLYLQDAAEGGPRLVGASPPQLTGAEGPTSELVEDPGETDRWPFASVLKSGLPHVMADLPAQFARLPMGPWDDPPQAAMVLPLLSPVQGVAGVLIAGISPRRALDDEYRSFLSLVAGQIATAITHARAYEAERKRAESLAALDRAKTAFFSDVSHEFRTPLALILAPLQDVLATADPNLSPDNAQKLDIARRNGLRLQRLVNTLLDFSRIEAGRVDATFEPTDLAAVTRDLASMFRSAVEKAGLSFEVACNALPEPVYVDRDMWEKIVMNLLSNALKFTLSGSIRVELTTVEGAAVLTVEDTGMGIPADEQPKVFDRFHRVRDAQARTHEGSGIGLSLASELARIHGGSIGMESTLGAGTTFMVTIPLGSAHLDPEHIKASSSLTPATLGAAAFVEEALGWLLASTSQDLLSADRASSATLSAASGVVQDARILVADDNGDMREYLATLLGRFWSVTTVRDGREALDAARAHPPDLVLSDVMMPNMDGFVLLHALRDDPRTASVPVMLLSARAGDEARIEGLRAGADDYLVKPFVAAELLARVGARLEISRVRREGDASIERERQNLYDVIMQAPIPMCTLRGDDLVFEIANQPYRDITGSGDVAGKSLLDVMPEVVGQGFVGVLRDVMRTGTPFVGRETPVRFERDSGHEDAYFTFIFSPMKNAEGVSDGVIAVAHDVTYEVSARQITEARARLAEYTSAVGLAVSEESDANRMLDRCAQAMVDHLGAAFGRIWTVDAEGSILELRASAGMYTHLDGTHGRVPVGSLKIGRIASERRAHVTNDVQSDPAVSDHGWARSEGMTAFAGHPLLVGSKLRGVMAMFRREPLSSDLGDALAAGAKLVGLGIERLRAEQELRDNAKYLQQANAVKDEFLGLVSHELRTPITTVLGNAKVLQARGDRLDAEMRASALGDIVREGERLNRIIENLLIVARFDRGQRPDLDAFELRRACTRAIAEFTGRSTRKIDLIAPADVWTEGEEGYTQQVLENLLSNADKYSPAGGIVTVSIRSDGTEAIVSVADTGPGVPKSEQEAIFTAFYRASGTARRAPGIGVGLAVCQRLVEAQGGRIWVESGANGGAVFSFALPLAASDVDEA